MRPLFCSPRLLWWRATARPAEQTHAMDSVLVKDWVPDLVAARPRNQHSQGALCRNRCARARGRGRFRAGGRCTTPESLAGLGQTHGRSGRRKSHRADRSHRRRFRPLGQPLPALSGIVSNSGAGWISAISKNPATPNVPRPKLERCYRQGARGVGELSDKGSGIMGGIAGDRDGQIVRFARDQRLHLDDSRLDPFWNKCAELKIPVNLHVADHPSAWRPPDNHQERLPSYQKFNQYGDGRAVVRGAAVQARPPAGAPPTDDFYRLPPFQPGQ